MRQLEWVISSKSAIGPKPNTTGLTVMTCQRDLAGKDSNAFHDLDKPNVLLSNGEFYSKAAKQEIINMSLKMAHLASENYQKIYCHSTLLNGLHYL